MQNEFNLLIWIPFLSIEYKINLPHDLTITPEFDLEARRLLSPTEAAKQEGI